MTCRELTELLMAYLDFELPPGSAERFEEHLSACRECRTHAETYRWARRLVGEVGRDEPPSELPEDLVEAILHSWT